jgi:hypothetical protein
MPLCEPDVLRGLAPKLDSRAASKSAPRHRPVVRNALGQMLLSWESFRESVTTGPSSTAHIDSTLREQAPILLAHQPRVGGQKAMSRAVMNSGAPAAFASARVDPNAWVKPLRRVASVLMVCGASWVALGACSPAAPPPPPPKAPVATASRVGEAPQCVDDKDQRVQCTADSDCCPHFVCGKDPDLSQAVDYCIFGG